MAAQHLFDYDMDLFNQESLEQSGKDIVDQEGSVNVEMLLAKELKREVMELLSSIDTKGGRKALRGTAMSFVVLFALSASSAINRCRPTAASGST